MDDRALLAGLRCNDAAAQAEFWSRFSNPTLRFICGIVRVPLVWNPTTNALVKDDSDAHDVLADTFVSALEGIGKFKGSTGAQLQAWLYTIARRRAIDFYRSKDRQRFESAPAPAPNVSDGEQAQKPKKRLKDETRAIASEVVAGWQSRADDGQDLGQVEEAHEVSRNLEKLTEHQRLAILIRSDGYSFKETGKALGISEAAAKMAYGRGIRELRRLMEVDLDQETEEVTFND